VERACARSSRQAHSIFESGPWIEAALSTADFLWTTQRRSDGALWRASNERQPTGDGIVDDYAFFAWACSNCTRQPVTLYTSGEPKSSLSTHRSVQPSGRRLLSNWQEHRNAVGRKVLAHDSVEPSGQSVMVQCMLRLGALGSDQRY